MLQAGVNQNVMQLEGLCRAVRGKLVELSHMAETPHLGGQLSCVDILVAAYYGFLRLDVNNPQNPVRDRLIFSKGHAVPALYVVLAEKGFFPKELLETFARDGSLLPEQPSPGCVPGVEAATGSLGHGLSIGIGVALAARLQKSDNKVVVIMSDGECNEGSVWEGALFAAAQRLNNLIVVIDYNKWQATGRSEEVMALNPLPAKWDAFGWHASEIDGHSIPELLVALDETGTSASKPSAIIAHTIKGKGVSFMEDDNNWHYRIPTAEEVAMAKRELGLL